MDQSDKDKAIALQRKKIEELSREIGVLKMENALLNHEIAALKKDSKNTCSLKYI